MNQPLTYQKFQLYQLSGFRFPTSEDEYAFRLMLEKGADAGYFMRKMVNPEKKLELYFETGYLVPIRGKKKGKFKFRIKNLQDESIDPLKITVLNNDGVLLEDTWMYIRSFINEVSFLLWGMDGHMLSIGYLKTAQDSYERLLDGNHRIISELDHDEIYYESDFEKKYWEQEDLIKKRNLMIVRLPSMTMKIQDSEKNLCVIDSQTGVGLKDFSIRHEISDLFIQNLKFYINGYNELDHLQNLPNTLKELKIKGYFPERGVSVPESKNIYIYLKHDESFKRLARNRLSCLEYKEKSRR